LGFCSKRALTDQIQVVGARVVIVLNIANIVVTHECISVVQVIPNGRRISIVLASRRKRFTAGREPILSHGLSRLVKREVVKDVRAKPTIGVEYVAFDSTYRRISCANFIIRWSSSNPVDFKKHAIEVIGHSVSNQIVCGGN
jgi:hypothetical protein